MQLPPGNYRSTINVTNPSNPVPGDVELQNVPPTEDDDQKLPPVGPALPRIEPGTEALNLTLHQVCLELKKNM